MKKINFLRLFVSFFKIGLLTIGGGFAMLPVLEKEVIEVKQWVSAEEVLNSYAMAQSVPGIIAVNTAVLLGYKLYRLRGAVAACLGVISPSIIIILLIAKVYENFITNKLIENALSGIRITVLALLFVTMINLIKKSVKDLGGVLLALSSFITVSFIGISPVYVIIAGVILSVLIYHRKDKTHETDPS